MTCKMTTIGTTKFTWVLSSRRQNHLDNYSFRLLTIYKISTFKIFSLADLFSISIDNLILKKRLLMLTNIVLSNKCYVLFFPTHKMKFKPTHILHIFVLPQPHNPTQRQNQKSQISRPQRSSIISIAISNLEWIFLNKSKHYLTTVTFCVLITTPSIFVILTKYIPS